MIYQALSIIDNDYNDTICVSDSISGICTEINQYVSSNFNCDDVEDGECMVVISMWENQTEQGTVCLDVVDFPYSLEQLLEKMR